MLILTSFRSGNLVRLALHPEGGTTCATHSQPLSAYQPAPMRMHAHLEHGEVGVLGEDFRHVVQEGTLEVGPRWGEDRAEVRLMRHLANTSQLRELEREALLTPRAQRVAQGQRTRPRTSSKRFAFLTKFSSSLRPGSAVLSRPSTALLQGPHLLASSERPRSSQAGVANDWAVVNLSLRCVVSSSAVTSRRVFRRRRRFSHFHTFTSVILPHDRRGGGGGGSSTSNLLHIISLRAHYLTVPGSRRWSDWFG